MLQQTQGAAATPMLLSKHRCKGDAVPSLAIYLPHFELQFLWKLSAANTAYVPGSTCCFRRSLVHSRASCVCSSASANATATSTAFAPSTTSTAKTSCAVRLYGAIESKPASDMHRSNAREVRFASKEKFDLHQKKSAVFKFVQLVKIIHMTGNFLDPCSFAVSFLKTNQLRGEFVHVPANMKL